MYALYGGPTHFHGACPNPLPILPYTGQQADDKQFY